jgi:LAO/AO transport system kinase
MDEKQLREIILKRTEDGKLTCHEAHRIAEALGVHLALIGRICNTSEEKIKITKCLLGCF